MDLHIRPAQKSDLNWIEEVRRKAYLDLFETTWGAWDEERHKRHFAAFLKAGPIEIIVAGGVDIGVLQVEEFADYFEVKEIQVLPYFQNQGFGSEVLKGIIERAKLMKKNVHLSLGLKNTKAYQLYRKLGFEECAERSETHIFMKTKTGRK